MFADPDTWAGGSIDLPVGLGHRSREDELAALRAIWEWPMLHGPFADRTMRSGVQSLATIDLQRHLYGVATVANGCSAAFATDVVVDVDGTWVYAGLPCGSLGKVYPIGAFPFGRSATEPWATEVYKWLFGLAQHLYGAVPFARGVIGWLSTLEVDELSRAALPNDRYHGYIVEEDGRLRYYPPTVVRPLAE